LPNAGEQEAAMLAALGVTSIDELFNDIPPKLRFRGRLGVPDGLSEAEACRHVEALLDQNWNPSQAISFLGGGVWQHLIPEALQAVVHRTEFLTAYTPYQPEISQGMLQTLFEYQSLIAELVDLPIVNASMYDWASALGESALMTARVTGRHLFLVPQFMSPERRAVLQTYAAPAKLRLQSVRSDSLRGSLDLEHLKESIREEAAGVYVENPAYLGYLEPQVEAIAEITHDAGAKFVVGVDPISLGVLRSPGDYGADIVVGEGQPLGSRVSFGGPLLGLFGCRDDRQLLRQLPGRLIGLTTTQDGGRRGYVMTLQTREQHIRREQATSNICSNQALCAVTAAVYLCMLGPKGLQQLGEQIMQQRRYAEQQLAKLPGVKAPRFDAPHFKEFVVTLEGKSTRGGTPVKISPVLERMRHDQVFGGIPLDQRFPDLGQSALVCVTEAHTKNHIDKLTNALRKALEVS
jgi:glycine dehydrogenase subunit 1